MRNARTGAGLWFWVVAIALASPAYSEGTTVCAVIGASGTVVATAADLLESSLAEDKTLRLVSRTEIQAVLNEQLLSAALSAGGTQSRLKLGRLVHADLLVFLKESREGRGKVITLSVAETKHGLRLVMDRAGWTPATAQNTLNEFLASIQKARDIAGRADLQIAAVSPFECKDVALDTRQRREGFARLIEQYLMAQPSVAVVEFAEARALAREVSISGNQLDRKLPYYFFGSYKTVGIAKSRHLNITLELRYGERPLQESRQEDLPESKLAQTLQMMCEELLNKMLDPGSLAVPVKLETGVLLERADLFAQVAEWDQAISLYESILLLKPEHERAHLQLMKAHIALMSDGSPRPPKKRFARTDFLGRMRHAECALDHLEVLLLAPPVPETQPASSPARSRRGSSSRRREHVGLSEALEGFTYFGGLFWFDNDRKGSKDAHQVYAVFQHAAARDADIFLRALTDERYSDSLLTPEPSPLVFKATSAAFYQYRGGDEEGALSTMDRLLNLLDEHENATALMITSAQYATQFINEQHFQAFQNHLEQSNSPRMRAAARASRVLHSIQDRPSLEKAKVELQGMAADRILSRLLTAADTMFTRAEKRQYQLTRKQAPGTAPATQPTTLTMAPKLHLLSLGINTQPNNTRPPQIQDWLVCGPDLELIATDKGVFRLLASDQLEPLWRSGKPWWGLLRWDGRYAWVLPKADAPILVLDPQAGKLAEFGPSDMPSGVEMPKGVLATIGPGRACFFGYLNPQSPVHRNYAVLLSIDRGAAGKVSKHSEVFFEARQTSGAFDRDVIRARKPAWAITLPEAHPGAASSVLVGGYWGSPLLLDTERRSVQELKKWPRNSTVLLYNDSYYVAEGSVSNGKQWSALYRAHDLSEKPELVVDLGERPFLESVYATGPYYSSMLVLENQLHLIAARNDFEGRVPAWVAVDLQTREAKVLVDRFPEEFRRNGQQSLLVSARYGLLLLSGDRAFRVELPPRNEWPIWQARSKSGASTTQATRPAG